MNSIARMIGTAFLALLLAAPVWADDPVDVRSTGRWQLTIDGEIDESAKIFRSEGLPRILILSEKIDSPLLIVAGKKVVTPLTAEAITYDGQDSAQVIQPSDSAGQIKARVDKATLRFAWNTAAVALEPREAMLGEVSAEALFSALPEYRRNASGYSPAKGHLRLLSTLEEPVELQVLFGSWCPHCERVVPRLLSVMSQLEGSKISVKLHGVPQRFTDDPLARQYKIEGLPTIILRRGNQEIGRIEGESLLEPEVGLTALLFGAS